MVSLGIEIDIRLAVLLRRLSADIRKQSKGLPDVHASLSRAWRSTRSFLLTPNNRRSRLREFGQMARQIMNEYHFITRAILSSTPLNNASIFAKVLPSRQYDLFLPT